MSRLEDSFQNAQNTKRDWLLTSIPPIKVLVVDYKKDSLAHVAEVLRSCSFEVTCVDHPGVALRLLTEKNNHYDLLLIVNDITNVDIHTFLKLTKHMDLLSIVMSEQEDDAFIYEVFKSGAFLVIKRPLTTDAVRRLRQDVIRYRMHKHEQCQNKNMITKNPTQDTKVQNNRSSSTRKNGRYESKKRVNQSSDDANGGDDDDVYDGDVSMKKKICVEWTKVLHQKFVDACNQLGEGRCYPKLILELMGVPGLTRMQVASHLQILAGHANFTSYYGRVTKTKYGALRIDICRQCGFYILLWLLDQAKYGLANEVYQKAQKEKRNLKGKKTTKDGALRSKRFPQEFNEKKFERMTSLQTNNEQSNTHVGIGMPFNGWQTQLNHMENQTYRCSSLMNIANENNIAQQTAYTQIPFGSDLELNQHDIFGRRITTTANDHFLPRISGSRDLGQGSKDYALSSFPRQMYEEFPNFPIYLDHSGPNDI